MSRQRVGPIESLGVTEPSRFTSTRLPETTAAAASGHHLSPPNTAPILPEHGGAEHAPVDLPLPPDPTDSVHGASLHFHDHVGTFGEVSHQHIPDVPELIWEEPHTARNHENDGSNGEHEAEQEHEPHQEHEVEHGHEAHQEHEVEHGHESHEAHECHEVEHEHESHEGHEAEHETHETHEGHDAHEVHEAHEAHEPHEGHDAHEVEHSHEAHEEAPEIEHGHEAHEAHEGYEAPEVEHGHEAHEAHEVEHEDTPHEGHDADAAAAPHETHDAQGEHEASEAHDAEPVHGQAAADDAAAEPSEANPEPPEFHGAEHEKFERKEAHEVERREARGAEATDDTEPAHADAESVETTGEAIEQIEAPESEGPPETLDAAEAVDLGEESPFGEGPSFDIEDFGDIPFDPDAEHFDPLDDVPRPNRGVFIHERPPVGTIPVLDANDLPAHVRAARSLATLRPFILGAVQPPLMLAPLQSASFTGVGSQVVSRLPDDEEHHDRVNPLHDRGRRKRRQR